MKYLSLLALAALTLLLPVSALAGTFYYPTKADTLFSIEIPDAWNPKVEDETLEATAAEEKAYLAFWVLKDKSDFDSAEKDLADILKDSVTDPKMGDAKELTVSGIKFVKVEGTGKDRKEKTPVTFEVWMFEPKPGKVGLLYMDRDTAAPDAIKKAMSDIVASIKIK